MPLLAFILFIKLTYRQMAVQVELWKPEIIEGLYKSNEFLRHAYDADSYVIGARVVHIPQAGAPSATQRNRAVLPATIVTRIDTDIVYVLDEYTVDPTRIANADTVELSYDKMSSVIRENCASMWELISDTFLQRWTVNVPATYKIAATGTNVPATAPGATGSRKSLTAADVRAAQAMLNKLNVSKTDRFLLVSTDMMQQLLNDTDIKNNFGAALAGIGNYREGVVLKYAGFEIMERSTAVRLDVAGVPKLPEAASATNDNEAAMFWQKDCVERALGEINMFDEYGRPEYYGDIFSFLVRANGRNRRLDNKGVGMIVLGP
jgi:hypothetical protein